MYVLNGMVYGESTVEMLKIIEVEPLENMTMILVFKSGEKRLYDAAELLKYPLFAPLEDKDIFMHPVLENGVVTWLGGELDLSPEAMFEDSYPYEEGTYGR